MALFQNTVIKKYLQAQNKEKINEKWKIYSNFFLDVERQERIRSLKEEQYQRGFLDDLFVKVLGYTLEPDANFNLSTEYKNVKDSKKADGAILIPMGHDPLEKKQDLNTPMGHDPLKVKQNIKSPMSNNPLENKVIGVIELKGTNTTDLGKIETQAFGYKNNQPDCVYIITSNFEKIRFYIDNAIEYLEFNLFQLQQTEFELLYLCLAHENLSKGIAKSIKDESVSEEDVITKKLYKDYSIFKRELFHNLVALNPDFEPLELFKKSQKLLDRFLFIFFAEDRQLLPPNSVRLILKQWEQLKELDEEVPLYERFKKYFGYLNTGYKGKTFEVYAYNGGLFKPDAILDTITINDDLLYKHTLKLSDYDFASEVDVNILGHIFENSLNELDEIKAQLSNPMGHDPLEKQITKRKKDGVFYTPKYITKYIVENTIGKLCTEKKNELQLIEEDYDTDKKRQKKTLQTLVDKLQLYRNWLLQLTICDPACGSGAFLNQALDFLIAEHKYIDELQAKLFGDGFVLSDVEKSILENNLFGVDLNEESVEIARLSLWLRTAQPNRKLNDLSGNIKCGNSLIDDPEIAGEKAFNWQQAFPQVFHEKQNKAFHLVFTTHNSRVSQRMIDLNVKKGPSLELGLEEEIALTHIFKDIIIENNFKCLAYNICKDHVHLILVCEEEKLTNNVQKIKSISSKLFHQLDIPMGHDPLEHKNHLWSQKFFFAQLDDLVWGDISPKPGYIANDTYLDNAIAYIKTNRYKHNLPESKELQKCINEFVIDLDVAFQPEYKGGFDVIVGNPPYVQLQSMGSFSDVLQKMNYQTFEKTSDLYCLFHELGNIILKENGLLGFITSNKWLRANYGKSLRNYLLENTQPLELIDLGSGIFDSATVDSNILIFEKTKNNKKPFIGLDISKEKIFTDFTVFEARKVEISPKANDIWSISNVLETKIKTKIEAIGTPLKDWDIKINYGIKTGFNDAFIIDEKTKIDLIEKDAKSAEIIVPILRGRDIKKYILEYANLYLINSHNGYKNNPKINIEDYPIIKKHLDNFYTELVKRQDKGDTPYNLRSCSYLNEFEKPKLFYNEIGNSIEFFYTKEKYYCNNKLFFLTNDELDLKFTTSLFNSKCYQYYFSFVFNFGGGKGRELFSKIPIPKISIEQQQPFIEKADLMLSLNKELQEIVARFQRTIKRKFFSEPNTKKQEITTSMGYDSLVIEHNYNTPMGHDPLEIRKSSPSIEQNLNTPMGHDPLEIRKGLSSMEQTLNTPMGHDPLEIERNLNTPMGHDPLEIRKGLSSMEQTLNTPMGHDPLGIKRNTTTPQIPHTIKINTPSNTKIEIELSKKLQDWYVLSYTDFIKELAKKKVKLSLSEEAEWEDYFMQESKKALDLKAQIDATDKAIDKMVYVLYGLSDEEIGIVEKS